MSQRKTGTMNKEHASKILGIQFSILSPDEIRKVRLRQLQAETHTSTINQ